MIKIICGLFLMALVSKAENYESTITAKKIKKSTQIEINTDSLNKNATSSFSDFLNYNSPMHFEFTLIAPPQWNIRGAQAAHTLMTIDGNPIFDPSTIQGTWDLNLWPNSWIKSTVLDFSALDGVLKWGGQASGAVIAVESIDTNQYHLAFDSKKSATADFSKIWNENRFAIYGQNKIIRSPFENSRETYRNQMGQALIKTEIASNSAEPIDVFFLTGKSRRALPDWNQDSRTFFSNEQHQIFNLNWNPKTQNLEQNFNLQSSHFQRSYLNTDEKTPLDESYSGSGFYFRYQMDYQMTMQWQFHLGFFESQERIQIKNTSLENFKHDINLFAGLASVHHYFENQVGINLGGRWEQSVTHNQIIFNPAASIFGTQWSMNIFKAVRNPSLFQSYDPVSGNSSLSPEEIVNTNLEFHDQVMQSQYQFVLFERASKNAIDFDMNSFKYENLNKTHTKGLEAHLNVPFDQWEWNLISTLQNSRNQYNQKLAPDRLLTSSLRFQPSSQNQWQIATNWRSEVQSKAIPSYSTWNLIWQIQNRWNITINNLTQTKVVKSKQYLIEDRTINFEFNSDF